MEQIFNTRKFLLSDEVKYEYRGILKELESNSIHSHKVVLFNDHKTHMSFVSLLFLFFHDIEVREAKARMMKIHADGSGELVVTSKSIAEKIKSFVTNHARNNGHPLNVEVHDI